ncbi:sensor histidine kinase [Sulfurimonas sp. NW15]|uniref:sensor histidine kinase n=1 Tax=Sulfurimonas sp. NW15 TaxID=2922729 RepID=UPI003DA9F40F
MKFSTYKYFFSLLLLMQLSVNAQSITSISENTNNLNVLKESSWFLDKNSQKSVSDILQKSILFQNSTKDFFNFGYIFKDTLWIKSILKNTSNKQIIRYFTLDAPNLAVCDFYEIDANNTLKRKEKNGVLQRKKFKNELFFTFEVSLRPHEEKTFLFALRPMTHSLHFHLKLQDYKMYKNEELRHQLLLTVFFSILLVAFIYAISISIHSDNSSYFYYALFIAMIFIHHLSLSGMIAYFLQNNQTLIYQQAYMPVYYLATVVFSIFLFTNKFLNLHNYKKIYYSFVLVMFLIVLIVLFNSHQNYLLKYMTPLAIVFALYLEAVSIYLAVTKKEKYAKYFAFIWGVSLGGMIFTMLYYVGFLSKPIAYLFEITVIFEIFSFSIILSRQIHTLQRENQHKNNHLQRQNKLAAMGEMLQNIAHQWRQPLSELNAVAMKIDADFYTKKITPKTLDTDIERIETITQHMSQTIENFSNYFKESSKNITVAKLEDLISQALRLIDTKLQTITVKVDISQSISAKINSNDFIQVLHVLLINAVDAFKNKNMEYRKIHITLKNADGKAIIEVEDNAGGIDTTILEKIFEPYFTTKFKSNGIGIGLYMAKMLVENSLKGELYVKNTQKGALFSIIL